MPPKLPFHQTHPTAFLLLSIFILCFIGTLPLYGIYGVLKSDSDSELFSSDDAYEDELDPSCNVQGVLLRGELFTYIPLDGDGYAEVGYSDSVSSDDISSTMLYAMEQDQIKAFLIEVDSGGGSPVAGEEIAQEIRLSTKPVVSVVRGSGSSAAYWAISPSDTIFASKNSDVGSIGVTSSYIDYVAQNKKDGLSYVQLSSGKFKDAGDPDRQLTEEEKNLFMRDIKITHQNFIEAVAQNRDLAVEKVRALADGSSMLGQQAKDSGLIDEIGGYHEATAYLSEVIGEEAVVCW